MEPLNMNSEIDQHYETIRRTRSQLQTALQFERWIEICESHGAYWRIVGGDFQLGLDYCDERGETHIARWENITSTRELWIGLGY